MADFSNIENQIDNAITTNGVGAITGAILNAILKGMLSAVDAAKEDTLTFDLTPTAGSTKPVTSGGVYDALDAAAQAVATTLTNYYTKTQADSLLSAKADDNAVVHLTSNETIAGVKTFSDTIGIGNGIDMNGTKVEDLGTPTADTDAATKKYVDDGLATKQDTLTIDATPTDGSDNPVASNGVYDALAGKQDTLTIDAVPTDGSDNPVASNGVYDALAGKQDTVSDLATIRSGAAAGATAVQPATMQAEIGNVAFQTGEKVNSTKVVNDLIAGGTKDVLSAEQGKSIFDSLALDERIDISEETHTNYINSSNVWADSTGSMYGAIISVSPGEVYKFVPLRVGNYHVCFLKTNVTTAGTTPDYAGDVSGVVYYTQEMVMTVPSDANYLYVRYINGVYCYPAIHKLTLAHQDINACKRKIINIGELVSGTYTSATAGQLLAKNTRVMTSSVITLPYENAKLYYNIKDGYSLQIISFDTALKSGPSSNRVYWLEGQGNYTFPSNDVYFRLVFAKGLAQDEDITAAEVTTLLENGEISFYVYDDYNVIDNNEDCNKYARAIALNITSSGTESGNLLAKLPMFAHISDLHGDYYRYLHCLEYAQAYGTDAVLVSGDSVAYEYGNRSQYLKDGLGLFQNTLLSCIGNHEVYQSSSVSQGTTLTESVVFNEYISPLVEDNGYLQSNNTPTEHTYYYKDFSSKQIRVIVLDQYCGGIYGGSGRNGRLGQEQITWLCNTLASTPSGYGVLIMMHSHEDTVNQAEDESLRVFNQTVRTKDYNTNGLYVGLKNGSAYRPISKIVDAFIAKTTLSDSYTEKDASGVADNETVTINADFTNVDASTEFIAYICGHQHEDRVGYYAHSVQKQLCITISAGIAFYGTTYDGMANYEDLPRGTMGSTQDLFNIYAVDRANGKIRIARIGANISFELDERKAMYIPYKD